MLEKQLVALLAQVEGQLVAFEQETPKMRALAPPGEEDYPYGDLVPLGLLKLAWEELLQPLRPVDWQNTNRRFERVLRQHQVNGLWAFDAGQLITAVDSAFVLCGLNDAKAVELLEQFRTANGGYLPQLFTRDRVAHKMTIDTRTRHWCQEDYSLLLQVHALRLRAGLPSGQAVSMIRAGYEQRSGLYLANPLLVDWLLADVLSKDAQLADMKPGLAAEVNAGLIANVFQEGYDSVLSVALALVTLRRLGYWSDAATKSLSWLSKQLTDLTSIAPVRPFYSTMLENWRERPFMEVMAMRLQDSEQQLVEAAGVQQLITFYEDRNNTILLAFGIMALQTGWLIDDLQQAQIVSLPDRYTCLTSSEYITKYALPPYLQPHNLPHV